MSEIKSVGLLDNISEDLLAFVKVLSEDHECAMRVCLQLIEESKWDAWNYFQLLSAIGVSGKSITVLFHDVCLGKPKNLTTLLFAVGLGHGQVSDVSLESIHSSIETRSSQFNFTKVRKQIKEFAPSFKP